MLGVVSHAPRRRAGPRYGGRDPLGVESAEDAVAGDVGNDHRVDQRIGRQAAVQPDPDTFTSGGHPHEYADTTKSDTDPEPDSHQDPNPDTGPSERRQ